MNSNYAMSNAGFSSRAGERSGSDETTPGLSNRVTSIAADLGAENRQDMFIYPVKALGLRREKATIRVTLGVVGKVEKASHGGTVVFNEEDRVNQRSTVTWEVTLGAGEAADLSYDLSVYR